ncbi:NADH dehydrogenase iron-sulfur protein 2, mitochondrial [Trichonephila clavipes]|nr:NADH dehydrogenase iron-sulfur protein 2, mitochondrial [Trichonephila clavipes]
MASLVRSFSLGVPLRTLLNNANCAFGAAIISTRSKTRVWYPDAEWYEQFEGPVMYPQYMPDIKWRPPQYKEYVPPVEKKIQNMILNFGPQHPAAHGVLRLLLELDGEHCIKSEKESPDLIDDAALVGYQKDYDELASLKEHKLGELALILPCPVLDCPENKNNSSKLNDPPENNAKKHLRQVSHDRKKIVNPNTDGGFTFPKKVAKKLKLSKPNAGTSQPVSIKNKFSSLAGKDAKVTPPISNQTTAPVAARPKVPPPVMFKHKKENYKIIIKDLNKDFPNCDVKLAGKYLKIFTTTSDEYRILTDYLDEKR